MKQKSNQTPSDLTYSSYLKVDELLNLQNPLSNPVAHDELLFIVIHQVYELWFKLIIFEVKSLISNLDKDSFIAAFRNLDRVSEIFKVLVHQIDILETMTPSDFNLFRSGLNPASGFQSYQFRQLEILSGIEIEEYDKFRDLRPEWKEKVEEASRGKNLRTCFFQLLERHGLLTKSEKKSVTSAIERLYKTNESDEILSLCEYLIRYDELIQLWRFRHVQMVERMIGMKRGTGGSLGVSYLQSTLTKRFFPELWEARTALGEY